MVERLVHSEVNAKRIQNVECCFGISGVPLGVPGRVLVGEGVLTKICRKKPKSRQFFLFNDILVYGTILINKKKYTHQHIIPLEGLVVEDIPDLPDEIVMKNGWLIKTSSKSFAVYAGSPSEKAEWMRHIKKCAYDLLEQTGRSAPSNELTAAVWIPDSIARICMACNQTQFTIINRRHHCRKCGNVICGNCSKNRVVIPAQSNYPVRVCNKCYKNFYSHLNKTKKTSIPSTPENKINSTTLNEFQKLNDDTNETKTCIVDATKDKEDRVQEWVNLASEQITDHLKSQIKDELNQKDDLDLANEAVENIKSNDENERIHIESNEISSKPVETDNNQTSDSEDEQNDLSSSVEDILAVSPQPDQKPTFYDLQLSKDGQANLESKDESKDEPIKPEEIQSKDEENELKNDKNGLEKIKEDLSSEVEHDQIKINGEKEDGKIELQEKLVNTENSLNVSNEKILNQEDLIKDNSDKKELKIN